MLRRIQLTLLFASPVIMAINLQSAVRVLEGFQWEKRLILVRAEQAERREIVSRFEDQHVAIMERDIVWFVFEGDTVETNYEGSLPGDFAGRIGETDYWKVGDRVLLIGKDGGVKARQEALDLEDLFRRIDSMPMRRAEMGAQE